jgi:hypothetical protein
VFPYFSFSISWPLVPNNIDLLYPPPPSHTRVYITLACKTCMNFRNRTDLSPMYDWFHPDAIKFMSPPPAAKHVLMQSSVANSFKLKSTLTTSEKNRRVNINTKSPDIKAAIVKKNSKRGSLLSTSPLNLSTLGGGDESSGHDEPTAAELAWGKLSSIFHSSSSVSSKLKIHPGVMNNLVDGLPNLLPGDMEFARIENRGHYRFAAGRVLPKPAIAALFSMACKLGVYVSQRSIFFFWHYYSNNIHTLCSFLCCFKLILFSFLYYFKKNKKIKK